MGIQTLLNSTANRYPKQSLIYTISFYQLDTRLHIQQHVHQLGKQYLSHSGVPGFRYTHPKGIYAFTQARTKCIILTLNAVHFLNNAKQCVPTIGVASDEVPSKSSFITLPWGYEYQIKTAMITFATYLAIPRGFRAHSTRVYL